MNMKKFEIELPKQVEIELLDALQNNDVEKMKALLAPELMNVVFDDGSIMLHQSASNGDLGMVKALIKAGADVSAQDEDGVTPLHHAAFNENIAIVKALIEAGADVNAKDNSGGTSLLISAFKGNIAIVKALIKAGEDVNAAHLFTLATPMHFAAINGKIKIVKALIKAGAVVNAKDGLGNSPATLALMEGEMDIYSIIQNQEAKVEKAKLQNAMPGAKAPAIKREVKAYI